LKRCLATRVIAALLLACFGCSLLVDTSDLNLSCPSGFKACDVGCVRLDDPAHSCSLPDVCLPCAVPHGIAACDSAGNCATQSCLDGYDCSCGEKGVNLYSDESNCGGCGRACKRDEICNFGMCLPKPFMD
jgi:hypothetical protein